jgi:hypothetical protein
LVCCALFGAAAAGLSPCSRAATIVLYDQNFENPAAFVNDGGDVNIANPVNTLYGNQPPGFTFTQDFTVETLLITGTQAFGTGYSDPSGAGGNYALGMLSNLQNDLLGLAFNVSGRKFLNVSLGISSIDLSVFGGPFVPIGGAVPTFEFTLFDNPSGLPGLGSGTILDALQASGTASLPAVFDWSAVLLALDASAATNGNVILRIDLLSGGYAALDNFRIAASDRPGDVGIPVAVPESPSLILVAIGLAALFAVRRYRQLHLLSGPRNRWH